MSRPVVTDFGLYFSVCLLYSDYLIAHVKIHTNVFFV